MILDNKTKSIEKCDIIGEHKINGIPNLYLRVNKTNKVFRLKAKKWLTLGIFGVDTSLRKAELLSKIISIKIKQGVLIEQLDSTLSLTKNPDDFENNLKLVSGIKLNNLEDIPTFIDVHQEWHKFTHFKQKWSKVYAQQTMNVPKNYVYPIIGNKQIHSISRKELTTCINNVYEKGINETARKMRGQLEAIFDYAIDHEWIDNNPVPSAKSTLIIGKKNRAIGHGFLKFEKIPEIVDVLLAKNTPQSLATIVSLITSKRVYEVCSMKWNQIHLKEKQWNVPSTVTKNNKPHNIPITSEFKAILEHLKESNEGNYVFPYKNSHISKESPRNQLKSIIEENIRDFQHINSEREPDAHGFRTNFGTWARQAGYDIKYIKSQQSHANDGSVSEMYNRYDWIEERRVLAQHWEDFCFGKSSITEKARIS